MACGFFLQGKAGKDEVRKKLYMVVYYRLVAALLDTEVKWMYHHFICLLGEIGSWVSGCYNGINWFVGMWWTGKRMYKVSTKGTMVAIYLLISATLDIEVWWEAVSGGCHHFHWL